MSTGRCGQCLRMAMAFGSYLANMDCSNPTATLLTSPTAGSIPGKLAARFIRLQEHLRLAGDQGRGTAEQTRVDSEQLLKAVLCLSSQNKRTCVSQTKALMREHEVRGLRSTIWHATRNVKQLRQAGEVICDCVAETLAPLCRPRGSRKIALAT